MGRKAGGVVIPDPPGAINTGYIGYLSWMSEGVLVHGPGSNFFIEADGTHVEGEYQAMKHKNPFVRNKDRRRFMAFEPGAAKKLGRKIDLREDWEEVKVGIMYDLVMQKFLDHKALRNWLVRTRELLIVEGNHWHDDFWGNCRCKKHQNKTGLNKLGNILMDVRRELK